MAFTPISPDSIAPPLGLYTHGLEVPGGSKMIVISGQVGNNPDGSVPPDFASQAKNAWSNCQAILAEKGLGLEHVVKINHFLTRSADIPEYATLRPDMLGDARPCSTLLVVAGLAKSEFLIEVEMVAAV